MANAERISVFGTSPTELFEASETYEEEGVVVIDLDGVDPQVGQTYKGPKTLFPLRVWHLNDAGEYVGVRHDIVSDGSAFGEYLKKVQEIGASIGARVFPQSQEPGREIQDQVYEVDAHGKGIKLDRSRTFGHTATAPIVGAWEFTANGHSPLLLTPGKIAFVASNIAVTQEVAGLPDRGPAATLLVADHEKPGYF